MAKAVFQKYAVNESGDVLPGAQITVINESTSGLVTLYSDYAGTIQITNPFNADANGFFQFYTDTARVKVTAELGGDSATFRNIDLLAGATSSVTSTAAGSIANNELFPELQNYTVVRDGVTDNWIATGASPVQSSPPKSFTFQSPDWSGLGVDTRIQFSSPNLGSLALKNADGTDLDASSLTDDQGYIAILNEPFTGAPYFGVQGLSSGIDFLTWPSYKDTYKLVGEGVTNNSGTILYLRLQTYFASSRASGLIVTGTFSIYPEDRGAVVASGITGAQMSLSVLRSDKITEIEISGLSLNPSSRYIILNETITSEIKLS